MKNRNNTLKNFQQCSIDNMVINDEQKTPKPNFWEEINLE